MKMAITFNVCSVSGMIETVVSAALTSRPQFPRITSQGLTKNRGNRKIDESAHMRPNIRCQKHKYGAIETTSGRNTLIARSAIALAVVRTRSDHRQNLFAFAGREGVADTDEHAR